jgi:hypothetical protein
MTEDTRDTDDRTLGGMSHTNPYTNESFGATQTYNRGQFAATDGGEAGAAVPDDADEEASTDEPTAEDEEAQTIRDVDHTPPKNAPSANAAYMAGDENTDDE